MVLNLNEFEAFMKQNGVKHITSAPYHPSTNGLAERFVQTFKNGLRSMVGEAGSITQKLSRFLIAYRNAPHATTGQSPASLLMGRNLRSRLDIIRPDIRHRVTRKQLEQTVNHKSSKTTWPTCTST